jgi:hypothetical protein
LPEESTTAFEFFLCYLPLCQPSDLSLHYTSIQKGACFDFHVGDKSLHEGQYTVSTLGEFGVVVLSGRQDKIKIQPISQLFCIDKWSYSAGSRQRGAKAGALATCRQLLSKGGGESVADDFCALVA